MGIITSKPTDNTPDPISLRPEPNKRYENVTLDELIKIGADIITAKRQVVWYERYRYVGNNAALLTEWRCTLRRLQATKKAAVKASQGRLF